MQAVSASATAHQRRLRWWREVVLIAVFYAIYSAVRNRFGSHGMDLTVGPVEPYRNAIRVADFQRFLGLYHEQPIQEFFLNSPLFIRAMNIYYGTAHFVVTITVFVLLYWKRPEVFVWMRNALLAMTGLAVAGFALFPLMPPRLLDDNCADYGPRCLAEYSGPHGFVDTLRVHGGLWDFDSGGIAAISNQYAAMPSLHIGWALWCAVAMWPLLRHRWQRITALVYPVVTQFCIIVTANHFWLDGIGGLVVFLAGLAFGWNTYRLWLERRVDVEPPDAEPPLAPETVGGGRALNP